VTCEKKTVVGTAEDCLVELVVGLKICFADPICHTQHSYSTLSPPLTDQWTPLVSWFFLHEPRHSTTEALCWCRTSPAAAPARPQRPPDLHLTVGAAGARAARGRSGGGATPRRGNGGETTSRRGGLTPRQRQQGELVTGGGGGAKAAGRAPGGWRQRRGDLLAAGDSGRASLRHDWVRGRRVTGKNRTRTSIS